MSRKKVDISKLNLAKIGGRIAFIRAKAELSQQDFGEKLGITKGNVSCFENHKYEPSFKILVQILEQYHISPNWLIFGKGNIYREENSVELSKTTEKQPHSLIVSRFKQKDLAWQINWDLILLEKLDPNELREIHDFINYRISKLEKREGDRRQKDDPEAIPGGKDRRSGEDRRETGT